MSRWSSLPVVAAVAVGAVSSWISRTLNVVVLTADTLSLLSVARNSIVYVFAAVKSTAAV